jgi:hypothetical protein
MTAGFAAATADRRHVLAIAAHRNAAFAAGFARFARVEFVRRSFGVSGLTALAGDFLLFLAVHRGEASIAACPRI